MDDTLFDLLLYREKKSLRHVVLVAKNLDDNKPKKSLYSHYLKLHRSFQFHLIYKIFAKFSFGLYLLLSKLRKRNGQLLYVFTYSIKRALEIRKFHVVVMHVQK